MTEKVEPNLNQLFNRTPDVSKKRTISPVRMSQCEKHDSSICHLRRAESEQWPPSDGTAVHFSLFLFGADWFECSSSWMCAKLKEPCLTAELFWPPLNTNPYLFFLSLVPTSVHLSSVNQEMPSLIFLIYNSDAPAGGFSDLVLVLHVWYLHQRFLSSSCELVKLVGPFLKPQQGSPALLHPHVVSLSSIHLCRVGL